MVRGTSEGGEEKLGAARRIAALRRLERHKHSIYPRKDASVRNSENPAIKGSIINVEQTQIFGL